MELRMTFNEDAKNYDRFRPDYPKALFDAVFDYAGLQAGSRVFEIGIGTGQATLPFLERGCAVTAAELGEELCKLVSEKYSRCPNFAARQGDFLEIPVERGQYDLVYSATAFHWLDAEKAYPKMQAMLRPGGCVALFWNHPFVRREDDPTNVASSAVYEALRPTNRTFREFGEEDCEERLAEMNRFGFTGVRSMLFRRTRTLTTEAYIGLLNTYSDHRALEPEKKLAFENAMRAALHGVGDKIHIYDTLDLYLGRWEPFTTYSR